MTDNGGGWYMEKSARGLPPLKRTKPSKKSQERQDEIQKKLYKANRWWSDRKLQLYWNNLEWVDPKYNPKRVENFSVSPICFTSVKVIEQLILLMNLV